MNKREKKTKLNFVLLVGKRFVVTTKKVSKKGKSTKYIYTGTGEQKRNYSAVTALTWS